MTQHEEDQNDMDATDDQLATLRELGIADADLQDLTYSDAEDWIAELRALREDAGKIGRD